MGQGAGRWPRWVACGLSAALAACVHPAAALLLLALALAARGDRPRAQAKGARTAPVRWRWGWVALAVLVAAVVVRPPVPLYWDAFVWLGKAKIESGGFGALRAGALDPTMDVIPRGYPIFWPLVASWFSMSGRTAAALTAGGAAGTLLALLLFVDAAADAFDFDARLAGAAPRPRWALGAALAVLGATPLVVVHLRSTYADLPVGLLAATCTLRLGRDLERAGAGGGDVPVAAVAAVALAGFKDEGIAHVTAIVLAGIAVCWLARPGGLAVPALGGAAGRAGSTRRMLAVLAAAAIPFVGWHALLKVHGMADADHQPSAPDVAAMGQLAWTSLASLADPESWGALWAMAFAGAAAVVARWQRFRPATQLAALALGGEALALGAALLFAPGRVHVFAFEGTLVDRLLIQLAPAAGALLMLALGDAAARPASDAAARPASDAAARPVSDARSS